MRTEISEDGERILFLPRYGGPPVEFPIDVLDTWRGKWRFFWWYFRHLSTWNDKIDHEQMRAAVHEAQVKHLRRALDSLRDIVDRL